MLIDPFNVELPSVLSQENESLFDVQIDEIINEIITKKMDILTAYQEGIISDTVVRAEIEKIIQDKGFGIGNYQEYVEKTLNFLFGYGPLEPYLSDPEVTDILGNDKDTFFIKKFGYMIRVPISFESEQEFTKFLYKIAAICGGKIDENNNAASVLTDRKRLMRIVITLKPLGITSPMISIRKHSRTYSQKELIQKGVLTPEQSRMLVDAVKNRKSIVIVGKGGSGKTTLLGSLVEEIPIYERATFIQETCEIMPKHPNVLTKLIRISDNDLVKDYTLFDLTKLGLLESLDRIIIAELKDKEAFDFFNAIYTGHAGSMTTLHTPVHELNPNFVTNRLLQLMARANTQIPHEELRNMLYETLDLIVFMKEFKVIDIVEFSEYRKGQFAC